MCCSSGLSFWSRVHACRGPFLSRVLTHGLLASKPGEGSIFSEGCRASRPQGPAFAALAVSKISDRETWPGTILKRYQNDNRNNGKVVICEYLAIPFSSYSSKMESYVRCATCSRKASGQLPLVRSCVTGPSQSVGGRLKSFQPS